MTAQSSTLTNRVWLISGLAWLVFVFLQSPGLTVADTKLDLTQNPWGFLAQALQPWTDTFPLGQLQNQAYGYLFPHGLFFALLSWLPGWIVQRLWWFLLLMLAFAGTVRLLEAARIGHKPSRVIAGILFALSPRIITTLGAISSEAWVVALAPWVLLPLVQSLDGAATGKDQTTRSGLAPAVLHRAVLRRAALRSAVAVLCMGAVNAVATAVAVLPAVIWWGFSLAKRSSRSQARYLGRWWIPAGIAACFWWIGPLLILGRYSPPFTDYIESSSLTTRWLNQLEVLRGTTSWVPFLSSERVGGAALVSEPVFIIVTLLVAFLGLWGLARRDLPFADVWLTILAVGLLALGAATAPFSPIADWMRGFLDGSGAALRNLHKFDVLVRLPLVVGIGHLLGKVRFPGLDATGRSQWHHPEQNKSVAAVIAAILLVVLATAPGWSGRMPPADGFDKVPGYWEQTADWLNAHAGDTGNGRTMILPEARFGRQTWGNTRDEPAQPLLDVPWVVRDSVPLVQPGAIRGLDGVQREVHSGARIPSLAETLRSQGVGHVVLRSDLSAAADTPGAAQVLRTLESSGGFREVAQFGQANDRGVGAPQDGDSHSSPAIRIFAVSPTSQPGASPNPAGGLRSVSADQVEVVHAGPEAIPRLNAADQALGRTASPRVRVLDRQLPENGSGADVFGDRAAQTMTDTPARRDHNYGNVVAADSEIRHPDDDTTVLNPVRDYPVSDPVARAGAAAVADGDREQQALTEIAASGGKVRASSSAADPISFGGAQTFSSLTSAVDGDPATAWFPSPGRSIGQYLEFSLDQPRDRLQLAFQTQGSGAHVHVETFHRDRGDTVLGSTTVTATSGELSTVSMPGGRADRIRLTLLGSFRDVGISEVTIYGANRGEKMADVTPRRVPRVPLADGEDAQHLNRWVFGQEIPEHTMIRDFVVPEQLSGRDFVLHTDQCNSPKDEQSGVQVDGDDHRCGDMLSLSSGRHLLKTQARWAALSAAEPLYAEAVRNTTGPTVLPSSEDEDEAADYSVGFSDQPRIIYLPSSANPGRTATLETPSVNPNSDHAHRMDLHPITVNGWQQGWVVPAGMSGTISIGFAATGTYQGWLLGGLVLAIALVGVWIFAELALRGRGWRPERMDGTDGNSGIIKAVIGASAAVGTAVLAGLIAGPAGLITLAGVAIIGGFSAWKWPRRGRNRALGIISGVAALISGVFAAQQPWTSQSYAGDSWVVQLALVALISAVYLAHFLPIATRAGSSTKE